MQKKEARSEDPLKQAPGLLHTPWRYTIFAVAFGVLVLGYEYREAILGSGLLLYLPILLCLGMHFFMHRGPKAPDRHSSNSGDG